MLKFEHNMLLWIASESPAQAGDRVRAAAMDLRKTVLAYAQRHDGSMVRVWIERKDPRYVAALASWGRAAMAPSAPLGKILRTNNEYWSVTGAIDPLRRPGEPMAQIFRDAYLVEAEEVYGRGETVRRKGELALAYHFKSLLVSTKPHAHGRLKRVFSLELDIGERRLELALTMGPTGRRRLSFSNTLSYAAEWERTC